MSYRNLDSKCISALSYELRVRQLSSASCKTHFSSAAAEKLLEWISQSHFMRNSHIISINFVLLIVAAAAATDDN